MDFLLRQLLQAQQQAQLHQQVQPQAEQAMQAQAALLPQQWGWLAMPPPLPLPLPMLMPQLRQTPHRAAQQQQALASPQFAIHRRLALQRGDVSCCCCCCATLGLCGHPIATPAAQVAPLPVPVPAPAATTMTMATALSRIGTKRDFAAAASPPRPIPSSSSASSSSSSSSSTSLSSISLSLISSSSFAAPPITASAASPASARALQGSPARGGSARLLRAPRTPVAAWLDLSARVPVKILRTSEWQRLSIRTFAEQNAAALTATGLARVSVRGVASLSALQASVPEQLRALVSATKGRVGAYRFRFVRTDCSSGADGVVGGEDCEESGPHVGARGGAGSLPIKRISGAGGRDGHPRAWRVCYKRVNATFKPSRFRELAEQEAATGHFAGLPTEGDFTDNLYWERVGTAVDAQALVQYPADIHASMLADLAGFPESFNMAKLDGRSDLLRAIMPWLPFKDDTILGYTTSNLYVGAAGTSFQLHAEDMNLGSVNFLLAGAPKVWYGVPGAYYRRVVDLVARLFPTMPLVRTCPQAVMHKQCLIHPDELRAHGIPVSRVVQRAGDLVFTSPGAFHWGYNSGWNIAEATNFADHLWWTGGHFKEALDVGVCKCIDAPRFRFEEADVRTGLSHVADAFGLDRITLMRTAAANAAVAAAAAYNKAALEAEESAGVEVDNSAGAGALASPRASRGAGLDAASVSAAVRTLPRRVALSAAAAAGGDEDEDEEREDNVAALPNRSPKRGRGAF